MGWWLPGHEYHSQDKQYLNFLSLSIETYFCVFIWTLVQTRVVRGSYHHILCETKIATFRAAYVLIRLRYHLLTDSLVYPFSWTTSWKMRLQEPFKLFLFPQTMFWALEGQFCLKKATFCELCAKLSNLGPIWAAELNCSTICMYYVMGNMQMVHLKHFIFKNVKDKNSCLLSLSLGLRTHLINQMNLQTIDIFYRQ